METNFLLELAYQQEQHADATDLLAWAEDGRIALACPSFAVAEALSNVDRRRARRNEAVRHIEVESRELARSAPRRSLAVQLTTAADELRRVNDDEALRSRLAISDIARVADLLPFNAGVDAAA